MKLDNHRVHVWIDINTREAVVGEMDAGSRHGQAALGDMSNNTGRLQSLAQGVTVVISGATVQFVARLCELEVLRVESLGVSLDQSLCIKPP